MRRPDRPLTEKQESFVREYLANGRNASAAYRAAYAVGRMSAAAVGVNAHRLLRDRRIAARVAEVVAVATEQTEITVARVLAEIGRVAFSDPRRLYRSDGTLKDPGEWTDDDAAAVAAVESEEEHAKPQRGRKGGGKGGGDTDGDTFGITRKLKRWDKVKALELLGRHLKRCSRTGRN